MVNKKVEEKLDLWAEYEGDPAIVTKSEVLKAPFETYCREGQTEFS